MTVKQLKEELSKYPDNMGIFFDAVSTSFGYGSVELVEEREIDMMETPDDRALCKENVLVLSEDLS